MRTLLALGTVVFVGTFAWGDGPAPAAPGVTLQDLLGDLAEAAEEIATIYPIAAPAPPWIDDLLDLSRRGALTDPADVARARALVEEVRRHQEADRVTRAGRQASANVSLDRVFGSYLRATLWKPPFLLCYATGERLTDAEFLAIEDPVRRAQKRAEIRGKQEDWQPLLEPLAATVDRVQRELLGRFGKDLGLKPLSDSYGGAPDLPLGMRSFQDGVPTVLWVFADEKALAAHFEAYDPRGAASARLFGLEFLPSTSWGLTHAEGGPAAVESRVGWLAARQLLYWHTRQQNRWKHPARGEDAVPFGFPAWLASVAAPAAAGRTRHAEELRPMQQLANALAKQNKAFPVYPVSVLFGEGGVGQAVQYGAQRFGMDHLTLLLLYRSQSFAFFAFLDEADGGSRRDAIGRLLRAAFSRAPNPGGAAAALGVRGEEEWLALDEAFAAFVRDDLLKR